MDNQRGSQTCPQTRSANSNSYQNPHGGVRRRAQRSSHSESHASEDQLFLPDAYGPAHGSRGEIVWFNSNMYEQAKDYFQNSLGLGTSQREQAVHRSLVFRAKRKSTQTQPSGEEGNRVRSRSFSAQKNKRSSSEPQRGRRKRNYSETERPTPRKRDKYGTLQGLG